MVSSALLQFLALNLSDKTLDKMPCSTTTAQAAFKPISYLQVSEALYTCETARLAWDSTSLTTGHLQKETKI